MLIFTTMINDVDDRAFMQEVYQQNERLMYAIALKYASNTQDCEDIVHDTVEKLCKNIAKIKELPNSALRAYVVYAVRNTAINFRKHQSTINRHIQQLSGDDSNSEYDQPESIIERIEDLQEKRTRLTKVWMQLTDAEQELLYRKYVLEQTTEELAGIFQCSRDSIRMRLSRARRKSLRLMKGEGTNDETRTTAGKL
jgi:RNA polymerase sigma factor (sigma-70 family)